MFYLSVRMCHLHYLRQGFTVIPEYQEIEQEQRAESSEVAVGTFGSQLQHIFSTAGNYSKSQRQKLLVSTILFLAIPIV